MVRRQNVESTVMLALRIAAAWTLLSFLVVSFWVLVKPR
jgi:hypothetical protein